MGIRSVVIEEHAPREFVNFHVEGDNTFICDTYLTHNCVIDDAHSEQEARSGNPTIFDSAYEWYQSGPRQRLQPGGAIVVLMTRWNKRDLSGRLIENMIRSPDGDGADHLGAEFDELGVRLAETEKVLRSMMFSLEENAAARTDLLAVVAEHVETFKSHASAAVEVIAHGDLELCTDSQRIAAERVLRESLSNIAKHAGAANVTIQLRGTRDSLLLQVRDDGHGFEPGDPPAQRHSSHRPRRDEGTPGADRKLAHGRQPPGRPDGDHRGDREVGSPPGLTASSL